MNSMFQQILILGLCLPIGIFAGHFAVYAFNRLPEKWFCDYGEEPGKKLVSHGEKRIKSHPWKWSLSMAFTLIAIKLGMENWQWGIPALIAIWILVEIMFSDRQYLIIPDQFVAMLAITGFGFIPFHVDILEPVWGMLLGLVPMLLIYSLGRLLYGKEIMGFGDVKLMGAIGFLAGPAGAVFTFATGFLASGLFYGAGILMRKIHLKDEEPLGPFLALAAIIYLIFYKDLQGMINIV